ncbi:MAG: S1C family serine protease [Firmicutes bacterium]|nr:S1C family serine protease [Bacillota bacterium]
MSFDDRPEDGVARPEQSGDSYRGLGPGTPRPRWHALRTGAAVAAIAVLAGGAGAFAARHYFSTPSTSISVAPSTVASQASAVGNTNVNVGSIAKKVEPAVVDINVSLQQDEGTAAGTGMILTSSGEVLTNNHVVEGSISIRVTVPGRGTYKARVIGVDPTSDVALLQIEGLKTSLPTVTLAGSAPTVGEPVVAIGNALGMNGTPTVTEGTITALGRNITAGDTLGNSERLHGMLQTDAALAPGDSGGPLVNTNGQVVGMDTAAYSGQQSSASFTNVGFAIPIARALHIVQQMQAGQASSTVILTQRPMIGVVAVPTSQASPFFLSQPGMPTSGAYVEYVEPNSPAAQAGITPGDVIVAFNGQTVTSPSQLQSLEKPFHVGQRVSVGFVNTAGQQESATMTLVPAPVP